MIGPRRHLRRHQLLPVGKTQLEELEPPKGAANDMLLAMTMEEKTLFRCLGLTQYIANILPKNAERRVR